MNNQHVESAGKVVGLISATPVFVVDHSQRIVEMNPAAREFFGVPEGRQVAGLACHTVVHGRELDGTPLCGPSCSVMRVIAAGEAPPSHKMMVPRGEGSETEGGRERRQWLPCEWQHIVIESPGNNGNGLRVIHVGRDLRRMEAVMQFSEQILSAAQAFAAERGGEGENPLIRLTAQERRVLRLLSSGHTTSAIAETLGVSHATTRNHIQRVLRKLECHTRLEAVALVRPFLAAETLHHAERATDLLDV
jgi:DNA-binding CsgD family transcriptional regulator